MGRKFSRILFRPSFKVTLLLFSFHFFCNNHHCLSPYLILSSIICYPASPFFLTSSSFCNPPFIRPPCLPVSAFIIHYLAFVSTAIPVSDQHFICLPVFFPTSFIVTLFLCFNLTVPILNLFVLFHPS